MVRAIYEFMIYGLYDHKTCTMAIMLYRNLRLFLK